MNNYVNVFRFLVANNSKNLYKFTEEEREEIEDILVRIVREIQKSLDKYPNPKKYAKKVLKNFESNITTTVIYLMLVSMNLEPNKKISPKELRKRLPEKMQLNPRQLTEALYSQKKKVTIEMQKNQRRLNVLEDTKQAKISRIPREEVVIQIMK